METPWKNMKVLGKGHYREARWLWPNRIEWWRVGIWHQWLLWNNGRVQVEAGFSIHTLGLKIQLQTSTDIQEPSAVLFHLAFMGLFIGAWVSKQKVQPK